MKWPARYTRCSSLVGVLAKSGGRPSSRPGVASEGKKGKRFSGPAAHEYASWRVQDLPQTDGQNAGVEKCQRKPGELIPAPWSIAWKAWQYPVGDTKGELYHPSH